MVSHNIQRGFEVIELAALAYRFKQTYNQSDVQISKRLRLTPPYVGSLLMLNAAPENLKAPIKQGKISATVVIDMLRESKPDKDATPNYKQVTSVVETALTEAAMNGKTTVSRKNMGGGSKNKAEKEAAAVGTPPRYLRTNVVAYLDFLCELATNNDQTKAMQAVKNRARKVLRGADVNPVKYLAEKAEAEAE